MAKTSGNEYILIIDFGSQVTQLIARRVRESGVFSQVVPCTEAGQALKQSAPSGVILSGGPASVIGGDPPRLPAEYYASGLPILGICYGQQTMSADLGGSVESARDREFGRAEIEIAHECKLFDGVWSKGESHEVWMSHGDRVVNMPPGFRVVAISKNAPFAAIADEARNFYGVQFHPEVVHTPDGSRLIKNFTNDICGCSGTWSMAAFRDKAISQIREQVGEGRVICGLSGGVDSAVAAKLIFEAIGDQLTCVFIDTGLLRVGEAEEVRNTFQEGFNIPLTCRDAGDLFLGRLSGVVDPEEKRKIIGTAFIDIFEEEARGLGEVDFLAQGTLYPDVIESISPSGGPSATIKSHHNVGGLPERMKLSLVEPLRELFKDEVRVLGRTLGLPDSMVERHPFPGPGLAIRIPGAIKPELVGTLRKADAIFLEEIRMAGLYGEIWQAFAVLLPVRTVGVMGDERTYENVCGLRAVTSEDGMTADAYPFSHQFLDTVSGRIVNEVRGINRVVYDVTSKPPGTIEWE